MSNFHPILFTSEMIRANIEGRKTQTRRVVMPQPSIANPPHGMDHLEGDWRWPHKNGISHTISNSPTGPPWLLEECPYGVPGDVLWARETWLQWQCEEHGDSAFPCECKKRFAYRADGEISAVRWKPSIHMPKWACRLWCRIESVRVQRVQEITIADCAAEGAPPTHEADQVWDSTDTYRKLWNRINEGRGFGWKANPWVWAITYTVLKEAPEGWKEYLGQLDVVKAGVLEAFTAG